MQRRKGKGRKGKEGKARQGKAGKARKKVNKGKAMRGKGSCGAILMHVLLGLGEAGPLLPMGLQRSAHECPRPMSPACTRPLRHLGLIFCWHRCAPVPEILGPPTPALKRSLQGGAGTAKQGNEKAAVQETKTQPVSLAGMFCISDELLRKLLLPQRLPLDLGQCRTGIKATPALRSLIHFAPLPLLRKQVSWKLCPIPGLGAACVGRGSGEKV